MSPNNSYVEVLTLSTVPQNGTFFGRGVIADVISQDEVTLE